MLYVIQTSIVYVYVDTVYIHAVSSDSSRMESEATTPADELSPSPPFMVVERKERIIIANSVE